MRNPGLRASKKRRFRPTTDSSKTLAPALNILQRKFNIKEINRVWVSDFTELPCRNGKAYAVAVMDLCSRRILGITVSYSMQTRTLIDALDQACRTRRKLPEEPLVFHYDTPGRLYTNGCTSFTTGRGCILLLTSCLR